jgi:hypothetical protein
MKHLSRLAFTVLVCVGALSACGGGGSGGGGDPAPVPPPVGGTPPPPVTPAAPSGTVWHSFSDLGNPAGTFAMNASSGVSTTVQTEKWGMPWPDGSRFISNDYTSQGSTGVTQLKVRNTADKSLVTEQSVEGYIAHIEPSPQSTQQLLAYWGENSFAPRAAVVWDLQAQRVLYNTAPSRTPDALDWMPDGSLLRVQPSGAVTRVTIGGTEQPVATLAWPESRVPQAVYVSPDGSKALVQLAALRDTGTVSGVDLWLMDANGSNLRRFTDNGIIAGAYWSPDGRYIAFTKDTGIVCTAATCQGSCTVWYAEATATNVAATEASGDAKQFTTQRPDGSTTQLRCPVMAWTR